MEEMWEEMSDMNYTEIAMKKINEVDLLPSKEIKKLKAIQGELQRCYEKKQMWRSEVEAKYSVLNKVIHPTPASRYWQSVREQSGMYKELISLAINFQEEQGKLELLNIEYGEIKGTSKKSQAQRKIKDAEIKRIEFAIIDMKLQASDRIREILMWEKIKKELVDNNDFDTENFEKHHLETYKQRWQLEKNIAIQTNNATVYKNSVSNLDTLLEDTENE